jgi:hypothetical protein
VSTALVPAADRPAAPPTDRPHLRLAPPAPARPPGRRDAAYAVVLFTVLTAGVLGVLLLNTAMQQQARQLAASHGRIAALHEQVQQLRVTVDRDNDPAALATRARRLHLRPARRVRYLLPTDLSGRRPAAGPGRAG